MSEFFLDTNVLLYLFSADSTKANQAEALLAKGGHISVQVLNEFAAVAFRKMKMSWPEVREALAVIRALCNVQALTEDIHERGIAIAERYGYGLYDSMILAAAFSAGCETVYSEDMQHGQLIEDRLHICNPFR